MSTFWRGKKVLLTGHTGFKGSWLSLWLKQAGAELVGYSLPPATEPSLFEIAEVSEGMVSIFDDIRDLSHLRDVFAEHRPEIVLHLAAQAIVRASYDDPVETYSTNVMGTVNVLEAVRATPGVRAVVVVTSDKCYDNREIKDGYVEGDPLGGRDPYSSSKGCAELVTRAYRDSFLASAESPVAVASARAGNVVGGGDWGQDRLVPDIMRSLIGRETLHIRNPTATRPWQHVLDPLGGYLMLAERLWRDGPRFSEAWNFGPADETPLPVGDMVERIRELWDEQIEVEIDPGPHPHEHHLLWLDPGKAERQLGWKARLSLPETLDWIVEWYRVYRDGGDVKGITEAQIARYLSASA